MKNSGASSRARLRTLKPRVPLLDVRRVRTIQPGATPRLSDTSGHAWRKIKEQVLREEPLCRPCKAVGRVAASIECDHIQPLEQGGTDERENLQGICVPCHRAKTARERAGGP
jgi:5-methylcytosine-specific restriction protein A